MPFSTAGQNCPEPSPYDTVTLDDKVEIVQPSLDGKFEEYVQALVELRKHKQLPEHVARDQAQQAVSPDTNDPLTPREVDVLQLLVEGLTNQAIAQVLGLSAGTVKSYVQTILRKLDVSDRTQAAVKAIRAGLVK